MFRKLFLEIKQIKHNSISSLVAVKLILKLRTESLVLNNN